MKRPVGAVEKLPYPRARRKDIPRFSPRLGRTGKRTAFPRPTRSGAARPSPRARQRPAPAWGGRERLPGGRQALAGGSGPPAGMRRARSVAKAMALAKEPAHPGRFPGAPPLAARARGFFNSPQVDALLVSMPTRPEAVGQGARGKRPTVRKSAKAPSARSRQGSFCRDNEDWSRSKPADKRKGPVLRPAPEPFPPGSGGHSRLPMNCSRNMNRLMKSR
jgi:hypothetical protein